MNNHNYEIRKNAEEVVSKFMSKEISSLQEGYDSLVKTGEYSKNINKHIANEINKLAYLNLFDKTEDKTFEFDLVKVPSQEIMKTAKFNFLDDSNYIVKTAASKVNFSPNFDNTITVSEEAVKDLSGLTKIAVEDKLSAKNYNRQLLKNDITKTANELKKFSESKDSKEYGYVISHIDREKLASDYIKSIFKYEGESYDLPINQDSDFYKLASDFIGNVSNINNVDEDIDNLISDISNLEKLAGIIENIEESELQLTDCYDAIYDMNEKYRGNK